MIINDDNVKITYLGKSTFDKSDIAHLKVDAPLIAGITNYTYQSYAGSWICIAVDSEWTWYKWDCWHCSCYWPLEHGYTWRFTKKEIIKLIHAEIGHNNIDSEDEIAMVDFVKKTRIRKK